MTPYPADAIEAAAIALSLADCDSRPLPDGVTDMAEYYRMLARDALAAFDAAMLAKGWKRVPRAATKDMKDAAAKAMSPGHRPTPKRVSCSAKHAIRYAAMWDKAPSVGVAPASEIAEDTYNDGIEAATQQIERRISNLNQRLEGYDRAGAQIECNDLTILEGILSDIRALRRSHDAAPEPPR